MKMEKIHQGIRFGNNSVGLTFQYFKPGFQFTPIELTIERDMGWYTVSFTVCNLQVVGEILTNPEQQKKWEDHLKESKEYESGDYYFFVHNKNKLLKEFAEYMESNDGLRFWQALTAWTGKDITVGGEDPFYWTNKLQ
jgi:hypothetical protein